MNTIPRLDADEWSMLASWTPDTDGRSLDVESNNRLIVVAKEFDMLQLALIEDNSIIIEAFLSE